MQRKSKVSVNKPTGFGWEPGPGIALTIGRGLEIRPELNPTRSRILGACARDRELTHTPNPSPEATELPGDM